MPQTMAMVDVRRNLTRLPEQLADSPETGAVAVTRRGKPVLAVMSWELYEAIVETLEVMGDDDLMAALKQSIRDIEKGNVVSLEESRKALDL